MIKDVKNYIEDTSGNIYKIIDSHFLMLSPCSPENKYVTDMEDDRYHIISYNNAMMIVNKQYNAICEKWNYNGESFVARMLDISTKDDIEEHTLRIRLLPDHTLMIDEHGKSLLKLVRHKGKMYYILLINERLPRVKAYDLFGNFCQWVGIQYCKPVWNDSTKSFE